MPLNYQTTAPSRAEIDDLPGVAVLEFGTSWCGFCQAAQRHIEAALADFPDVRRMMVEDGKGRPLGRSFGVRLWPTLIFLSDGKEIARVVRPGDAEDVSRALAELNASNQSDG